jgi:hypothetical protein
LVLRQQLLVLRGCPRPDSGDLRVVGGVACPRVQRGEDAGVVDGDAGVDIRVGLVAVHLGRVEPGCAGGLPQGEEPVDIGVQEEHERVMEGEVRVAADGAPEPGVHVVVRGLQRPPEPSVLLHRGVGVPGTGSAKSR